MLFRSVAAALDRASFRVLSNEALLALAGNPPREQAALKALPGVSERLVAQRGDALLAAIERGLAVPEKELPRFPRGERRTPDPTFEARVDRLKAARNSAAQSLGIDPGVLCPKATLEAAARANAKGTAELLAVPDMRRWQVEALGSDFLRALAG